MYIPDSVPCCSGKLRSQFCYALFFSTTRAVLACHDTDSHSSGSNTCIMFGSVAATLALYLSGSITSIGMAWWLAKSCQDCARCRESRAIRPSDCMNCNVDSGQAPLTKISVSLSTLRWRRDHGETHEVPSFALCCV
ncbi:hypothetical protein BDN71DRAFT_1095710 [Pleurotus eryngii]|uniref:Uncharacterized protein n=1 Tax=Pleurotus eryngii TaxID=5323 RepID=A0A9P5ZVI5_PLEER|nr:hypothetical protein BDN71DRAFT_1095710 [Pleurotus eryngii]